MSEYCLVCGKETFKRARKYCSDCYEEKDKEWRKASIERRKKNKQRNSEDQQETA